MRFARHEGPRVRVGLLVGLVVLGSLASGVVAADDPVLARAFEVRHRPVADAADLIGSVLSPEGKVTFNPRLSTLVVEDRVSVLDRVASLLASYDLPPRNVEITFSLFLGTDSREDDPKAPASRNELAQEVRGVLETLSNFTKWETYESLGSRSVRGTEGDRIVADLSDEYRVVFKVDSVHESSGTVTFDRLQLQRFHVEEDGSESVENLYTAGAVLEPGKLHVVGAAKDPDSNRALFLMLQAVAR